MPANSSAGKKVTPSLVTWRPHSLPFEASCPSTIRALILNRANRWPQRVPALASLIPPVSGDLPPTDSRAEVGAELPVTMPGEKISLLLGPRGWAVGGTSSAVRVLVSHRPPIIE